jgi:3-hydroxyacyl-[acyl-carrier-protein] dehydratase
MDETAFECQLCIGAGHPALPGHFPGHPLVPGVVLLEQVVQALHAWRRQRVLRVLETKFMAPLLPNETAVVRLTDMATGGTKIRFEIRRGDVTLARGVIEAADE